MKENLESLVQALRAELQDYGELLARLEEEQQFLSQLRSSVDTIEEQWLKVRKARLHREDCRNLLSVELELPPNASFDILIQQVPSDYRPLVTALIEENNELFRRVQQRARLNPSPDAGLIKSR